MEPFETTIVLHGVTTIGLVFMSIFMSIGVLGLLSLCWIARRRRRLDFVKNVTDSARAEGHVEGYKDGYFDGALEEANLMVTTTS